MNNVMKEQAKEDIKYLLSFVKYLKLDEEIPKGLDPTQYMTTSFEGDLIVQAEVNKIKKRWDLFSV